MIAIINTGERDDAGRYVYRVQINSELIATFAHDRADGLAECLRCAAEAVDSVLDVIGAGLRPITDQLITTLPVSVALDMLDNPGEPSAALLDVLQLDAPGVKK